MSLIKQGIYIGNFRDAADLHFLQRCGVTHVLCSAAELFAVFPDKFIYKHVQANDIPSYNLSRHFDQAADFIKGCLDNSGTCFIHCAAGISRSVSLTIAYFLKHEGLTFQQAMSLIKSKRYIANPNPGFVRQLKEFESKCQIRNHTKEKGENPLAGAIFSNTIGTGPLYVTGNNFRAGKKFPETEPKSQSTSSQPKVVSFADNEKLASANKAGIAENTPNRANGMPILKPNGDPKPPETPLSDLKQPAPKSKTVVQDLAKTTAVKQPDYLIKQYSKPMLRQDGVVGQSGEFKGTRTEEPRKPPLLVNQLPDPNVAAQLKQKSGPSGGFGGPSAELFNRYLKVAGVSNYHEPRIATHPTKQAGFRTSQNFRTTNTTQPTQSNWRPTKDYTPAGRTQQAKLAPLPTGYFY